MKLANKLITTIDEGSLPKAGDRVKNNNSGRRRESGSVEQEFGIIKKVSKGYAYVDFGRGGFTPIHISDLTQSKEDPKVWQD